MRNEEHWAIFVEGDEIKWSFGDPKEELLKILHLSVPPVEKNKILSINILRLLETSNR